MKYSNEQLLDRVAALPTFDGWPNGPLDIWVRSRADGFNIFDDAVYTFDCSGDHPVYVMKCSGTSNAGSYGLLNFRRYNPKGCAVLCSDIIVYNSHIYGTHKGKPAYVQNWFGPVPFPYTRDSNRNTKAENYGVIYNDLIGANCHRAGIFSRFIQNWSTACLVRNVLNEFLAWLRVMNKRPLTVAILREF